METFNQLMQERNRIKRVLYAIDTNSDAYKNGLKRLYEISAEIKGFEKAVEEARRNILP